MRGCAKNMSEKCDQDSHKNCRPDILLPKPLRTADPEISGCFLIQILLL